MVTTKLRQQAVSKRAVLQRVNRRLAEREEAVKTHRSSGSSGGQAWEAGDFYQIDISRNSLIDSDVDLESLARELGALAAWEKLADE